MAHAPLVFIGPPSLSQVLPTFRLLKPVPGLAVCTGHWGAYALKRGVSLGCGGWPLTFYGFLNRDCCGPHLLLPGGCLPQPAWRQEAVADTQLLVSAGDDCIPLLLPSPQATSHPWGTYAGLNSLWIPSPQEAVIGCP